MIGKFVNNLKNISLTNCCLFFVVVFLFIISSLLFSIEQHLAFISMYTSTNTANTYGILFEMMDKNNTDWTKEKVKSVDKRLKVLDELMKK